jgi:hypothetical protein
MANRSTIEQLAKPLQDACHEAIGRGATIDEITAVLNGLGADVSRSAVGRYTKNYSEIVERQREISAMAATFGKEFEDNETGEIMTQLMQQLVTQNLLPLLTGDDAENLGGLEISRLAKAVKDVAGAKKIGVDTERAIRAEERQRTKEEAAQAATGAAKKAGADKATIDLIREQVMGL